MDALVAMLAAGTRLRGAALTGEGTRGVAAAARVALALLGADLLRCGRALGEAGGYAALRVCIACAALGGARGLEVRAGWNCSRLLFGGFFGGPDNMAMIYHQCPVAVHALSTVLAGQLNTQEPKIRSQLHATTRAHASMLHVWHLSMPCAPRLFAVHCNPCDSSQRGMQSSPSCSCMWPLQTKT